MPVYNVELIHEPTGAFVSFEYESDTPEDEVWNEILADLSVVAFAQEE